MAAEQAAATRARNDELRRNPTPIHGGAHWATSEHLAHANLLEPDIPDVGPGLWLGTTHDSSSVYWQGESHLLTVAPTRTGKGTMQIIPNLLRYQGSAVVLDPKGELAAATAAWREAHIGPVHILNPFGLPAFGGKTAAFNPLDQVTDAPSALKLAEMIYPRTDDDRQRFFDNEAIGFLSAVLEFTACFAPTEYRTFGTIRDTVSTLNEDFYRLLHAMTDPRLPPAVRNGAQNRWTKPAMSANRV